MMQYQLIHSVGEISDQYDLFLIDIGGVIYDGVQVIDSAIEAILQLKRQNRKIIFLTNSPELNSQMLAKFSAIKYIFEGTEIVTAGDFTLHKLGNDAFFLNKRAYLIGEDMNSLLHIAKSDNIEEADYLLISAVHSSSDAQYDATLERAAHLGLPCVCLIPDLKIKNRDNVYYVAGTYAGRYQRMGGKVLYHGKPMLDFYEFALRESDVPKSKILAIGDSIETDIVGAAGYGIKSLLVLSGGTYYNQRVVDQAVQKYQVSPDYVAEQLT